ncbi:MAG: DUF4255 domain-containing protein [Lentisphaeraceae bacterium]|nr:DUF4255 domain-containing protein [Lentisphaeraceae bacterium]
MSSYLALATTTAVFSQKIYNALNKVKDLSAAPVISNKRPEKPDGQMVGAYLYLYQVEHNNTLRNNDLATRRSDGTMIQQPQVALNLKYHISFYGRESTLEAQRMMGAAIIDLHSEPFITPAEIKGFLDAAGPYNYLAESTLYEQHATIKIEPVILSLEDISKMWTTFFQIPHEHSLNYEVSVILIEGNYNIEKSLPASGVNTLPDPSGIAKVLSVQPPYFEYPDAVQTIELKCESISKNTKVRFLEAGVDITPEIVSPTLLKVQVPQEVRAGLNEVVLVKEITSAGKTAVQSSDPYRIIVQPVISAVKEVLISSPINQESISTLKVTIKPFPSLHQHLTLWMNASEGSTSTKHYSFDSVMKVPVKCTEAGLNAGELTKLQDSLTLKGISISKNAKLSALDQGVWLLADKAKGNYYSIYQLEEEFVCFYGFQKQPELNEVAFKIEDVEPGSYLVRIQVDKLQFAESILIKNEDPSSLNFGKYIGPEVSIS